MIKDGRQMATTLDAIRADHVERYRFAAREIGKVFPGGKVLDAGCGFGYGSFILANAGFKVISTDIDAEVFDFAKEHWDHPNIERKRKDWGKDRPPKVDAIVAFEVLEHFDGALTFMQKAAKTSAMVVGSVPNQDVIPFDPAKHHRHVRHYRPPQVKKLLALSGWDCTFLGGQLGKRGPQAKIVADPKGTRTIVFVGRLV